MTKNKNELFIERRKQGDYQIIKPDAKRASAVEETQKQAIEKAKILNPEATIHIERVRDTDKGGRDKWRKPKLTI